jgi:hypothetical protein
MSKPPDASSENFFGANGASLAGAGVETTLRLSDGAGCGRPASGTPRSAQRPEIAPQRLDRIESAPGRPMALNLRSDNMRGFRPAPFRVEIFRPDAHPREVGRGRGRPAKRRGAAPGNFAAKA